MHKLATKIKALFFDMDGTLLNSQYEISKKTCDILAQVQKNGIKISICSARAPQLLAAYMSQLEIQIPIVAFDGAYIYNPLKTEPLFCQFIKYDTAQKILKFSLELGLDITAYTTNCAYLSKHSNRLSRLEQYNEISRKFNMPDLNLVVFENTSIEKICEEGAIKFFLHDLSAYQINILKTYISRIPSVRYGSSEGNSCQIVSQSATKGSGVTQVCKYLSIPLSQICCFGNYYNDLSMMQISGYSVAMGNAPDAVKQCATFITATNDNDGVYEFIKNIFHLNSA